MLVDWVPVEHVGRDRMRSVQSNTEKCEGMRRRFGVLLLYAGQRGGGAACSRRLLVDRVSAERLGCQGLRQLQQNGKGQDGVRGEWV